MTPIILNDFNPCLWLTLIKIQGFAEFGMGNFRQHIAETNSSTKTCSWHHPWLWASWQIRKISGCTCAGNAGKVFFLWRRWRGKRSRHSRRMRNPQFYVSGKSPYMRVTCLHHMRGVSYGRTVWLIRVYHLHLFSIRYWNGENIGVQCCRITWAITFFAQQTLPWLSQTFCILEKYACLRLLCYLQHSLFLPSVPFTYWQYTLRWYCMQFVWWMK